MSGKRKVLPSQGIKSSVAQIVGFVKDKRLVVGFLVILIGVLMPVSVGIVGAISKEQEGRIAMGCDSVRVQLRALQKTDSRMRVYLGSKYEILLTGMMTNLNLRLIKNGIANEELTRLQREFSDEREVFKADFTHYSQGLSGLLEVDCKVEPGRFYEQLVEVRKQRAAVQESYEALVGILAEHRVAVEALRVELAVPEEKKL